MKQISKILILVVSLFALWSCEKAENKIYFEGGTAPVLSSTVSGNIPLSFANEKNEVLTLRWTNPDFNFTTGGSSQSVSYILEIDTTGANFTNPKKKTLAISGNLSKSFTHAELNDYLLNQLELLPERPHNIEMRVKATIAGASQTELTSNVIKYTVVPYKIPPKVDPPTSGNLYITGGATPAGWMADNDAPVNAQKFTKISDTKYELASINLKGGQPFLFVPVYGNWSDKYGYTGDKEKNNVDGDEFKRGGNDFKAPDVAGNYKIVVDFQTGKYTVTKI